MHYTGPVYRHPLEADTPIVEISYGCSWNKCNFCNMYEVKFGASPEEHIVEDLEELSGYYPKTLSRIIVANGDPLSLSTKRLLKVSELIQKYFPEINTISCQSSIRNLMHKSQDEIDQLAEAKYNDIYIGLESGSPHVLKQMNKGYTQEQEYETLKKLKNAGIRYIALLMGGVGGYDYSNEHVIETAKLLNAYPPKMVSIITTGIVSGTKLDEMAKNGEFKQLCEKDVILEEMELIEKLNLPDNTYFFGHHNNNLAPVSGYFSDKEELISNFEDKLREIPQNVLESKIKREYL